VLQLFAVSVSLSEILNHQGNVSGSKYNKDNNNELFHRAIPFGWVSINHDRTISA
jgi:hypothetical protein